MGCKPRRVDVSGVKDESWAWSSRISMFFWTQSWSSATLFRALRGPIAFFIDGIVVVSLGSLFETSPLCPVLSVVLPCERSSLASVRTIRPGDIGNRSLRWWPCHVFFCHPGVGLWVRSKAYRQQVWRAGAMRVLELLKFMNRDGLTTVAMAMHEEVRRTAHGWFIPLSSKHRPSV